MKKKCTFAVIALIVVMLFPAYAEADKSLDAIFKSATVFTKKGINRFYVNGYYRSKEAYSGEKILTLGNQDYIPAKLIPEAFPGSATTAQWIKGNSENPSQSLLLISFSQSNQKDIFDTSGPFVNKELVLNANSKKAKINGKEVMLSHAVIYMNGKFFIPVSIMEPLFGLKMTLIDDLYFWGEDVPSVKSESDQSIIKAIQGSLKTPEFEMNDERNIYPSVHVKGKTYFHRGTDLWVKDASGKEKLVSLPKDASYNLTDVQEGRLYYKALKNNAFFIYEYDLATEKTKTICNATKELGLIPEQYERHIKFMKYENKGLTLVLNESEPSRSETLYSVHEGKAQRLFGADEIEKYIVTGDKVFYTFNTAPEDQSNLRVYSVQTKKSQSLGQAGARYLDIQVKNGKLYAALPVLSKTSPPERTGYRILCQLDMQTGEQVELTPPTKAYWVSDQIYYVDGVSKKLVKVDHQGKMEKTLVNQPIDKIQMQGQDFYYTLEGHLQGVYGYSLKTGAVSTVMPMAVDELILLNDGVWGLSYGYAPGFYKAEDGQAVCKFSGRVSRFLSNGTEIMFNTYPSETLKFIK